MVMQLTKFLDALLKNTASGAIKWVENNGTPSFMTVSASSDITIDKPISFNGKQITVTLQRMDRLSLTLKYVGKNEDGSSKSMSTVFPTHKQSGMNAYIVKLYDAIAEAQIDSDFFGTPPLTKKLSKPVNS